MIFWHIPRKISMSQKKLDQKNFNCYFLPEFLVTRNMFWLDRETSRSETDDPTDRVLIRVQSVMSQTDSEPSRDVTRSCWEFVGLGDNPERWAFHKDIEPYKIWAILGLPDGKVDSNRYFFLYCSQFPHFS